MRHPATPSSAEPAENESLAKKRFLIHACDMQDKKRKKKQHWCLMLDVRFGKLLLTPWPSGSVNNILRKHCGVEVGHGEVGLSKLSAEAGSKFWHSASEDKPEA